MRKYIVQHLKSSTLIQEVECEYTTLLEDPSLAWRLQKGEIAYKILQPPSLKNEMFMGWSLFSNETLALEFAQRDLKEDSERNARKSHSEVDYENLKHRFSEIKINRL